MRSRSSSGCESRARDHRPALSVAVDQVEAAIPYVPGDKVIREDDFGDPVYEDTGMTPEFLALVKKYRDQLGG